MKSKSASYNLPLSVAIGALFGIMAGVLFGEDCRVFSSIGSAYVMLLQAVVYPYIICSLLHGLGRLTPLTARRLLKKGWFFFIIAWGITFATIILLIQALPSVRYPAVMDAATEAASKSHLLTLLIPANPFSDLANNYVPAVVVIAILYGVAIQHYKRKEGFLEILDVIRTASVKIWNWIVLLSPFAVFALFADTAGTVNMAQLEHLIVYVFLFLSGTFLLAFWVLPAVMAAVTPVTSKEVIREIQAGIVLSVATTLSVVALPFIMEASKKLALRHGIVETERDEIINTTLSISYPLGQLGNFFVGLFIPFAAFLMNAPLSISQKILLPFFTLLSCIGSPSSTVNAVSFLGSWLHLPDSVTTLYVETMTITRYGQVVVSVMGFTFLTLLITFSYYGKLAVHPGRLLKAFLWPALLFFIIVLGVGGIEKSLIQKRPSPFLSYSLSPATTKGVDVTVIREGEPIWRDDERPIPHESTLDRIRRTGSLRVAYSTSLIPFSYLNSKGELVGYDVAFAYELAKALDVKLIFVPLRFKRGEKDLAAKNFDIIMCGAWASKERIKEFTLSKPYFQSPMALLVPSDKTGAFLTRKDLLGRKDLKVGVLDGGVIPSLLKNILPNATPVFLKSYDHVAQFEGFDATLWSLVQASAYARSHEGATAVRPKEMGSPCLFAYLMPPDSLHLVKFVNYWLDLKETEGFTKRMKNYWILGMPRLQNTRRWCVMRDVLHWRD
ncbi:MAG: cation:dicarboxylase symporter family transporter [Deltaproteobacteria bacterium]|nr:cation:dicarboxylase symporter family transporter [Deltaproteobacteria bacterium]